ncbi:tripartite tricarboxylate transporter substrate binding protein [soil metagenome]
MNGSGVRVSRRQACGQIAGALAAVSGFAPAVAAGYPDRAVKIVVPYAAGGGTDLAARVYAEALGTSLKQTFVVDNRPGASGITGTSFVAKSPPDGYTLILGGGAAMTINQSIFASLPYDPVRDFVAISLAAKLPLVMVVSGDLPVKTVAEFIDYAKKQPQGVTFSSPGTGTIIHLAGELFMARAGVKSLHIPYKGSSLGITDVASGQVNVSFDGLSTSLPLIRSGKLRALALSTSQRNDLLPDVPTLQEAGFKDFDVSTWYAFFAPAKTPPDVVQRLSAEVNRIARSKATLQLVGELGLMATATTPEQLEQMVREEGVRWREVVQLAGIKPQ